MIILEKGRQTMSTPVTIKHGNYHISFNDSIAVLQILSGIPYAVYELITFSKEQNLEQKVLLLLWGIASVVDVGSGILYFVRKAGIKVKIPKHLVEVEKIITTIG